MLGAEEEKEREILKKCNSIFPGNKTFQNVERHEPPTVTTHGMSADGRRTNEEAWPKGQFPVSKQ